jgi:linoleate 8R-lipoxygenase/9,12-octadecadienoate 8-hydroperoxide 8R-isomerase
MGFQDVSTLLSLLTSEYKGQQDDNKFLLEHLVQLLSKQGVESKVSTQLTNAFINNLWNAIPHPPMTSLGKKYQYREADGSNNNSKNIYIS